MTTQQISDLIFSPFQEEATESIKEPWSSCVATIDDTTVRFEPNFEAVRIGDVLYIEHKSGKKFRVTVEEVQ